MCTERCSNHQGHTTRAYNYAPRKRVWHQVNGVDEWFKPKLPNESQFKMSVSQPWSMEPVKEFVQGVGDAAGRVLPFLGGVRRVMEQAF